MGLQGGTTRRWHWEPADNTGRRQSRPPHGRLTREEEAKGGGRRRMEAQAEGLRGTAAEGQEGGEVPGLLSTDPVEDFTGEIPEVADEVDGRVTEVVSEVITLQTNYEALEGRVWEIRKDRHA